LRRFLAVCYLHLKLPKQIHNLLWLVTLPLHDGPQVNSLSIHSVPKTQVRSKAERLTLDVV
jgi:hypothetical protein